MLSVQQKRQADQRVREMFSKGLLPPAICYCLVGATAKLPPMTGS